MTENELTPLNIWDKICFSFPILMNLEESSCSDVEFSEIMLMISDYNLTFMVEGLIWDKIKEELRRNICPSFCAKFTNRENENDGFEKFKTAVDDLYTRLSLFLPLLVKMETLRNISNLKNSVYGEESLINSFKVIVKATLHSQLPLKHQVVTEDFYRISFKVFCNNDMSEIDTIDPSEDLLSCGGCGLEVELCKCKSIIDMFHETNRKLNELELLEPLAGEVLTSLIHKRIENHVQETCKGSFNTSYISSLENWLQTVVMGWLSRIYSTNTPNKSNIEISLNKFKQKLKHLLYETYTRTRIDQLFTIIIEYPDSDPAVEDLRLCLEKTDLRGFLIQKLQRALETRLLHPGVNTPDILTAYISAIRALRQLDPTGVLLETVTQPVRHYLRCREGTVRCIVTSLTEEGPSDLEEELARGEALQVDDHSPQDDMENWEIWNPDPIDADPSKTSKSRRTSDIISMFVNVYGSKELFVNEYRTLLADRLLSQFTYNNEKEIRYLELLKIRFGDAQLHYCEVMLKDMYDSKRINAHLLSDVNFDLARQLKYPTNAMILSAQFWPPFREETLELPAVAKEQFDIFTKAFETLKGNRTLCWKPHLGSVNLEIELKDRTLTLTVSPIHATIIWHFQEKTQWMVEELSQKMLVPATVLRRRIAFWQTQGILKEISTDCFLLMEDSGSRSNCPTIITDVVCEDEEAESAMASAHDQREEELQVFWSYIVGMLTNLDSLPLERIHQMLKMFASQGPTSVECSVQELRHFLDRKVREHKLLFSGGFYRLPKS